MKLFCLVLALLAPGLTCGQKRRQGKDGFCAARFVFAFMAVRRRLTNGADLNTCTIAYLSRLSNVPLKNGNRTAAQLVSFGYQGPMKFLLLASLCCFIQIALHADDASVSSPDTDVSKNAKKSSATTPAPDGRATTAQSTDPKAISSSADASITPPQVNTRYGIFDALDKRSIYGQGVFPEPFLVDDSDGEVNEARLDWLHTGGPNNMHTDRIHGEVEKGIGLLTLEFEAFTSVIRTQARSPREWTMLTWAHAIRFTCGSPPAATLTTLWASAWKSAFRLIPKSVIPLSTYPRFSTTSNFRTSPLQSILGYSIIGGRGGSDGETDGGIQSFEYGFVLGYTIDHAQLAIPGVQQIIPVMELSGERQMNKDDHGDTNTVGDIGFRANLDTIGPVQPRLGIVFVFPVDYGARQDQNWGIDTSLVFEY